MPRRREKVCDFWRVAQEGVDLPDFAAGLGERGAGLGVVVEHEAAFVDGGHEAGGHAVIGEPAEHEQRRQRDQQDPGAAEQTVQRPGMRAAEPAGAGLAGIAPAFEVDELAREHGDDEGGHQVGDGECRGHGDRERLRERAGHAGEEAERDEDDQGREARAGERRHELARGGQHGGLAGDLAVGVLGAGAAGDVLDHDDHVVDQQADGGRDAAERHDVEAEAERAEHEDRGRERGRDDQHRDQRDAETAQEEQQHQPGEHQADQHGVAHAGGGLRDQDALVVPVHHADALRQLEAGERLADGAGDLDGVAVGLFVDVEQDGGLAVFDDADPLRDDAVLHGREVADPYHARGVGADDGVGDLGAAADALVGDDEEQLAAVLQLADRLQHVAGGERLREVGHAEAVGGEAVRIGQHLDFGGVAALHVDPREAGDGGEQRHDLVLREVAQRDRGERVGLQRVGDDREYRRVHPADVVAGAGRQAGEDLADGGIDQQGAGDHVAAPAEIDRDLRRAAGGVGADVLHAGDGADGFLDGAGDQQGGLVGGTAAGVEVDDDAGEGDLREQADGEREAGDGAGGGEGDRQDDDGAGVSLGEGGQRHRRASWPASARTAMPSSS